MAHSSFMFPFPSSEEIVPKILSLSSHIGQIISLMQVYGHVIFNQPEWIFLVQNLLHLPTESSMQLTYVMSRFMAWYEEIDYVLQ